MNINHSTESMMYQKSHMARTSPLELSNANPLESKFSHTSNFAMKPSSEQAISQAKQSSGVVPQLKSPEQMIQDQQAKKDKENIQFSSSSAGNIGKNVNIYV